MTIIEIKDLLEDYKSALLLDLLRPTRSGLDALEALTRAASVLQLNCIKQI